MNLTEFHQLLDRALAGEDRDAAELALREAVTRGRRRQGLLAWMAAYGPFLTTESAGGMPSQWHDAVSLFVAREPLFGAEEAVHVLSEALAFSTDIAEFDGKIDIWARVPAAYRRSLETPRDGEVARKELELELELLEEEEEPLPQKKKSGAAAVAFGFALGLLGGSFVLRKGGTG